MSINHLKIVLANRKGPHEHQTFLRYETLERAVAEFKAMADHVCTCGASSKGYEINTDRANAAPYTAMMLAGIDHMQINDKAIEAILFEERA